MLFPGAVHAETDSPSSHERRFLITQINLGNNDIYDGSTGTPKEYVAITNVSDTPQAAAGLKLELLKASAEVDDNSVVCDTFPWSEAGLGGEHEEVLLDSTEVLEPGQTLLLDHFVLVNTSGGSLRLTEVQGEAMIYHDLVGWNRGGSLGHCFFSQPVEIGSELIATRLQHFNLDFQDTNHNANDFRAEFGLLVDSCANIDDLQLTVPVGMEVNELGECSEATVIVPTMCDQVRINEILPNPSGSDDGNEFIELHNTSDKSIKLNGCALQVDDGKDLVLDDFSLAPNEYRTFSDTELGFTLTNSSGGTVYWLSPTDEVEVVVYPENLDDDQSYAWFGGVDQPRWRATYTPTPSSKNTFTEYLPCPSGQSRNLDTNRCNNVVVQSDNGLGDCGPGRYRHPDTNRCRNLATAANALVPCSVDQYRSPETNRCRKVTTASSGLKACQPGQYRNPETNRCKKIEDDGLKPCGPGQERNPETNRCRNVGTVASASTGSTQTTNNTEPDAPQPSSINVPLVAAAALAAAGYGLYEYRQDIRAWIWRIKQRFSG